MGRRRYQFDEKKVVDYLKAGRGTGTGSEYQPWLKIHDVPSRGRSHRTWGIKTKRIHHFLSDGEWKSFLRFEADPQVIDIREQFPMNRMETHRIALRNGIRPPSTTDGTPYVLTIDFLVTRLEAEGVVNEPYSFKYSFPKLTQRQELLMSIADEYWQKRGLKLRRLDESLFDNDWIKKYDAVRSKYCLDGRVGLHHEIRVAVTAMLCNSVVSKSNETLAQVSKRVGGKIGVAPSVVFELALHLIARGQWRVDLFRPGLLDQLNVSDIQLNQG